MTVTPPPAKPGVTECSYPGCRRPTRPDPATGRPSKYCEQADPDGVVHNRATAFKARRAEAQGESAVAQQDTSAPLSMARATLEQHLAALPNRITELRQHLDDVLVGVRAAGDVEAAGAEVEDAHREALAKVVEAERKAAAAERAARIAESDRDESDALAEQALEKADRLQAEVERLEAAYRDTQTQHEAAIAAVQDVLATAHAEAAASEAARAAANDAAESERATSARLREDLEQSRQAADDERMRLRGELDASRDAVRQAITEKATVQAELAGTRAELAAVQRAVDADQETLASLNKELDNQRAEARAERQALRQEHAEQLEHIQRSTDERVQALVSALNAGPGAESKQAGPTPPQQAATTNPKSTRRRTGSGPQAKPGR